jgi:hypothetical protein
MNLTKGLNTARNIITANSPVLLVGTAVAGVVSTGILAARGGYKARGIVDEAENRYHHDPELITPLEPVEKVRLTWLCYAVPAVTGASSIASVLGVHTIHTKRHAALAGLYAVTAGKFDDYRDRAEELLGSKKTQELNDAMARKSVERHPFIDHEVILADGGTELMQDEWSGRYFQGTVPIVEKALYEINLQLAEGSEASLNEYYDHIGLKPIPMGVEYGWSGKPGVEPRFGSATVPTPDGVKSVVVVSFRTEPQKDMGILR